MEEQAYNGRVTRYAASWESKAETGAALAAPPLAGIPPFTTARDLVERLAARGVLSKETHETVIRFAPPLTITHDLIDRAVDRFREVALQRHRELGLGQRSNGLAAATAHA